MKINTPTLIQRLYVFLLRLYPVDFQREFSGEMIQVFHEASQQAQGQGLRVLAVFFLKEFIDLPFSLLREHGWILFHKEARMSGTVNLQTNVGGMSAGLGFSEPPSSWKEILLAGLPYLAVAYSGLATLLSGLGLVPPKSLFLPILSGVLAVGMLLAALGTFIFAWRKHWPRWSAGWYGFWFLAALAPVGLLMNLWDLPNFFYVFVQPLLWFVILMGIAWFLYRLSCQDAIKGVLAALPFMGLTWFIHQEFVRDDLEGAVTLVSWLLVALAAAAILRLNNLKVSVLLALGTNILIGLAYAFEGIYFGGTLNFDAPGPNGIQVLRSFLPHWVTVSTLVIGPLLARHYRKIGYRLQPLGLWLYRLVLLGLLLILTSNIMGMFVYTDGQLRAYLQGGEQILNILAWVGLAVFSVGFGLFSRKAVQEKVIKKPLILPLLGLLSLFVPFGLMFGLPSRIWMPSLSLSHDIWFMLRSNSPVDQFPELWLVGLGVLWTLAASWLAVILNTSKQPAEELTRP